MPAVRLARADDADGVARVHVSSWQAAYRDILPAEYLAGLRWQTRFEFWVRQLVTPATDGSSTWVLAEGARVLGFAAIGPARDEDRTGAHSWELYGLYLTDDLWGHGWGRVLATAALDGMPDAVEDVSLWVLALNDRARRFYERLGFTTDGKQRIEPIGGRDVSEVRYLLVRV
jgi:RimJ/RimL family protein N-acetyltransferase